MAATTTATDASAGAAPPFARPGRRLDHATIGWAALAIGLSAGVGLLAGAQWRIALDAALVLGAAALFAWRPYALLLGLLVLISISPASKFLELAVLSGGGLALALTAPRLPVKRVSVPLLILVLIALPSVPLTPSPDEGLKAQWLTLPKLGTQYLATPSNEFLQWVGLASVAILFCVAALVVRHRERLRILVATVLASAVVPIAIGLHDLAVGNYSTRAGTNVEAIEGPFDHPNYFALYLLTIWTLATVCLLEARRLRTIALLALLTVATSVCLFFTYTRGAWIGVAVVVVVLTVLRYRHLWLASAAVVVVVVALFPSTPGRVEQRLDVVTGASAADRNSWSWRRGQWERTIPYGAEHPLTGQGFGSYFRVTVREFGLTDPQFSTVLDPTQLRRGTRGFAAHNDFVKMFVEMGFPGLLLWTGALLGLMFAALALRRTVEAEPYATAVVALTAALIVFSASDTVQDRTSVGWIVFAFSGAVLGVGEASRAKRDPRPTARREWKLPEPLATEPPPAPPAEHAAGVAKTPPDRVIRRGLKRLLDRRRRSGRRGS